MVFGVASCFWSIESVAGFTTTATAAGGGGTTTSLSSSSERVFVGGITVGSYRGS